MPLDFAIGLRSTRSSMAIDNSPARLSVEQRPAELSVQTEPARLDIRRSVGKLEIDSTQPRAETGYLTYYAFLDQTNAEGRDAASAGIARIVQTGEAYKAAGRRRPDPPLPGRGPESPDDWRIAFKPLSFPSIRYTPGELSRQFEARGASVQFSARPPIIEVQAVPPRIEFVPASLQIYLRRVEGNLGDLLDMSA